MEWSLWAMVIGVFIDLFVGDPHGFPHPVALIGRGITCLEALFRKIFPATPRGERMAGAVLWSIISLSALVIPAALLTWCSTVSPWLRLALESLMCWQILAIRSLRDESMKVFYALKNGTLEEARYAVSMIVGRDTEKLDKAGVTRAAVETVAENTSDGVIAPLFFMMIGGAPLAFFYKAVNTMDSMLGSIDPPYRYIGLVPAKMDDFMNFLPARISALLMLAAGVLLKMKSKRGWHVFFRDRFNHASPNSAQTESVCAGLLGIRLGGNAWYHGVLHEKKYIGDAEKEIEYEDIPRACRLMYVTAGLAVVLIVLLKLTVY